MRRRGTTCGKFVWYLCLFVCRSVYLFGVHVGRCGIIFVQFVDMAYSALLTPYWSVGCIIILRWTLVVTVRAVLVATRLNAAAVRAYSWIVFVDLLWVLFSEVRNYQCYFVHVELDSQEIVLCILFVWVYSKHLFSVCAFDFVDFNCEIVVLF